MRFVGRKCLSSFPQITQIFTDDYGYMRFCENFINTKTQLSMKENEISFYVRKSIFSVYNELGPGLLEKVYEKVLMLELENHGLKVRNQVPMSIKFKDTVIDSSFIADIIVEDKVIIEIKSIQEISEVHHKQLLTYLKLSDLKLGILVNFNTDYIAKNIFRKINGNLD